MVDETYRSALALNNMAVSMLERNCYEQAASTFKSAVSLVRCCAGTTEKHEGGWSEAIHAARQRHAKPRPDARADQRFQLDTIGITVSTKDLLSMLILNPPGSSSATTLRYIRVEDFDSDTTTFEMISAILLYNLGLSYYCLSKTFRNNSADQRKFQHGAARLCRISHSLFCKHHLDDERESEVMILVVLRTLVAILQESQQCDDALSFAAMLRHRQWTVARSSPGMLLMKCFDDQSKASAA